MTCKRGNTDHDMNKTYTLAERMEQTDTRINSLSGCHLDLQTPRCTAISQADMTCKRGNTDHDMNKTYTLAERMEQTATRINSLSGCHLDLHTPRCTAIMQPGRHDMQEREYRSRHEQNIHACRKNGTNSHKNQLTEWLPSRSTDSEMHRYQPGRHDMQEREYRSRHEQNIHACRKNGTNSHKNQLTDHGMEQTATRINSLSGCHLDLHTPRCTAISQADITCKRGNTDHDMNKTYTLAERMEQTATRINSLSGCHLDIHTPRCTAIMQPGRHDKQEREYRSRHEQNIHACRKNGPNSHKNQLTEWLPSRSTHSEMHRYHAARQT